MGGFGGAAQAAAVYTALYSFTNITGAGPVAGLISDSAGNLYGTTEAGGTDNEGVVFELKPPAGGQTSWTETVLHSFKGIGGKYPFQGLIADGAGNLYGTTNDGGAGGYGVVFELSRPPAGKTFWTPKVLVSFKGANGKYPQRLIFDKKGNLYGSTAEGGPNGTSGLVFELSPPTQGATAWTETVLCAFPGEPVGPQVGLMDAAGNLYGTTGIGGRYDRGTLFELSPPTPGQTAWTETTLHSFGGPGRPGGDPNGVLIADAAGNFYGTTMFGGANLYGAVFELSPPAEGQTGWTETTLFSFDRTNGSKPDAGLLADYAGNLYGTTTRGGAHNEGVLFELSPPVTGQSVWTETLLYSFGYANGSSPQGALIVDEVGNLYGTACCGGAHQAGVVFKLTP